LIAISDPAANVAITLNPMGHTATSRPLRTSTRTASSRPVTSASAPNWQGVPKTNTHVTSRAGDDLVEEILGEDSIHGIVANGTKITRTIPVGHMGNDLPIIIVTERWYSDVMKMVVLLKQADPRVGETTTEVTNVVTGEPAPSLFQIPSDYSVEEPHTDATPSQQERAPSR
jgi:hypothetical protein